MAKRSQIPSFLRTRVGTTARRGSSAHVLEKGSTEAHEQIVRETLILLGREAYRLGRFFRNETGVAYRDDNGRRTWIAYGIKGSPDIYGILLGGTYIGLEIKSGNATQQPNQKAFQAMVESLGGRYKVCRSAQEALEFVFRVASGSRP